MTPPGVRDPHPFCLVASPFLAHPLMVHYDREVSNILFSQKEAEDKGCKRVLCLQGGYLDAIYDSAAHVLLAGR